MGSLLVTSFLSSDGGIKKQFLSAQSNTKQTTQLNFSHSGKDGLSHFLFTPAHPHAHTPSLNFSPD